MPNRTGIEGVREMAIALTPEQGGDGFTTWQGAPREELGLEPESRRMPGEFLLVDKAGRVPPAN